jgi:hypothetical protein
MLFQKRLASTSWREALDLSLGTFPVGAEPAEIVVPSFAKQENIDLMVGDADTGLLQEIDNGAAAGAIESSQMVEAIDRYGEIDVATLVQDFDPVTLEGLEARDLTSRASGLATEPNNAIARTSGIFVRSAAIMSAARRNVACRASMRRSCSAICRRVGLLGTVRQPS